MFAAFMKKEFKPEQIGDLEGAPELEPMAELKADLADE